MDVHRPGAGKLRQMQTKVDKREGGCYNYNFCRRPLRTTLNVFQTSRHTRSATTASAASLATAAGHDDAAGASATAAIACKVPRLPALVALVTVAISSRSLVHHSSASATQQTLQHNISAINIMNVIFSICQTVVSAVLFSVSTQ